MMKHQIGNSDRCYEKVQSGMNTPMPSYLVANKKLLYYNYNLYTINKVSAPTIVVIVA